MLLLFLGPRPHWNEFLHAELGSLGAGPGKPTFVCHVRKMPGVNWRYCSPACGIEKSGQRRKDPWGCWGVESSPEGVALQLPWRPHQRKDRGEVETLPRCQVFVTTNCDSTRCSSFWSQTTHLDRNSGYCLFFLIMKLRHRGPETYYNNNIRIFLSGWNSEINSGC